MAYHITLDVRFINSGTGTYAVKLLEYLQQIDTVNQYSVLVPTKDATYWRPTNPNFTIRTVDFANYSFGEQIGFKHYLERLNPDLVHFCMPQQPVFYKGPHITTVHDMTLLNTYNSDKNWLVFHLKQLVGRWVFRRIGQTSDHIIAISHNTKREYQVHSRIPDEKISVIYEAGEAQPHSSLTPYLDLPFKRFILYVGQQPDYKNLRRLAAAHQSLLTRYPDLGLVFVGRLGEDAKRNQAYYQQQGYRQIHFTGFLPDGQRDWLLNKAAAYVFPSLMEGFGLPPLETMAYGTTPVISSNASCMPEILGDAAEYFDPLDIDDIAAAIDRVLSQPGLRRNLIAKGLQQAKKYSWERCAQQTHAVYMDVLTHHNKISRIN